MGSGLVILSGCWFREPDVAAELAARLNGLR
jgi:hypothetical protein